MRYVRAAGCSWGRRRARRAALFDQSTSGTACSAGATVLPGLAAHVPAGVPASLAGAKASAQRPLEDASTAARAGRWSSIRPPYVVIDRAANILRFSGGSAASWTVARRRQPRPVRHAAPGRCAGRCAPPCRRRRQQTSSRRSASPSAAAATITLRLVQPIPGGQRDRYLVAFIDRGRRPARCADGAGRGGRGERVELAATRAQLLATIDHLETANEELKSSNEEYQSANEELQATNEELETSKEEMQSINEELQTVNTELTTKNEQLPGQQRRPQPAGQHADRHGLPGSGPAHHALHAGDDGAFRLREADIGRPATEIASRLAYSEVGHDAAQVLRDLSVVEREVHTADDASTFLMHIRPYRRLDDVIDGVVLTFFDITDRKRHEQDRATLAAIVDSTQDAVIGHTLNGTITSWNKAAERIFGYTAAEAVGKPLAMLIPPNKSDEIPKIIKGLRRGKQGQV